MSAIAQRNLAIETTVARSARPNGTRQIAGEQSDGKRVAEADRVLATKVSEFVAADNRLLRETLARMLMKKGNIEVTGLESGIPMQAEAVAKTDADVLLLASRGALNDDLLMIQEVRVSAPGIRILLLGMAKNEAEFLQCVRAGIRGYLLHDASSDEVLEGVRAVHAGEPRQEILGYRRGWRTLAGCRRG
jgi:ActR/RegA family two-component response regulator